MEQFQVAAKNVSYPVTIESGLFEHIEAFLSPYTEGKRVVIVSDSNVSSLYGEACIRKCRDAKASAVHLITIPAGEKGKTLEQVTNCYGQLLAFGMTRSDILIALGGGTVGDVTGFLASTYLRGIPYLNIPTTLLSDVDSAIGGKTAVNLPQGKNLVGTFYHPQAVWIDPYFLNTLNERERSSGMGEVVKYAVIQKSPLLDLLEEKSDFSLIAESVISECCKMKAEIVAQDPEDHGIRMLLNFGHTIGHALEGELGYGTLSHGAAVAIGMCEMTAYTEAVGMSEPGTTARLKELCVKYGLPTQCTHTEALLERLCYDKKQTGESINIVYLKNIGNAIILKEKQDALFQNIRKVWGLV